MWSRYRLALALFGLVTMTCPASTATNDPSSLTAVDPRSKCTLVVPKMFATVPVTADPTPAAKAWGSNMMTWSGPCKAKRAHGNGVARMMSAGKVIGTWYGDAKDGLLDVGVLEDSYGFNAGKFNGVAFLPLTDQAVEQRAVGKAIAAAAALSATFRKMGNTASEKYYLTRIDFMKAMLEGE